MIPDNVTHHAVVMLSLIAAWRHVRLIVIAARKFLLLVGFDEVDAVLGPDVEAIVQVRMLESCVGAGGADDVVGLVIVDRYRLVCPQ